MAKKYSFVAWAPTKTGANKLAKAFRKDGKASVRKDKHKGYGIYIK